MIAGNLLLLIARLLDLLVLVLIADVVLSWIPGLNPANPFVRVIHAISTPVFTWFRGWVPVARGVLDLAPLLAIVAVLIVAALFGSVATSVGEGASAAYTFFAAVEQLLLIFLAVVVVLVLGRLLLALFQVERYHPMSRAIGELSRPFCQPFEGMVAAGVAFDVAALAALITYIVLFVAIEVIFNSLILPLTIP